MRFLRLKLSFALNSTEFAGFRSDIIYSSGISFGHDESEMGLTGWPVVEEHKNYNRCVLFNKTILTSFLIDVDLCETLLIYLNL